jgi:MFS family permease
MADPLTPGSGRPTAPDRPAYRWVVLAVSSLAIFGAGGLSRFGYSAVLPAMQKALGLTGAQAGSLASWNLAGYTVMALVGGVLAARFGARIVVTAGIVVTALGLGLTGLSNGLPSASAARLLTGLGNGVVMSPSVAVLSGWFDSRQVGLASAVASAATGLGPVVAGPVVPRIIQSGGENGWRTAWYLFAGVALVVAVISGIAGRDHSGHLWERKGGSATPRQRISARMRPVLRSGYAWHLGAIYMLYGFAYLLYYTFFQKRLTVDLGLSSAAAGDLFMLAGGASVVFGVLWGAFSDRLGRGRAMAVLFVSEALAAALFALRPGLPGLVTSAVVFGIGVFSVPGLMGAACGDRFSGNLAFAAFGFVTAFIGVGQAVGPYVGGALEDAYSSLAPSYLVSAGVFVLAGLAAFLLPEVRGQTIPCKVQ